MPSVSVIVAVYNGERFLAEAIESIRTQTYRDFELIVVDDGSRDRTRDILRSVGNSIRVIRQENAGMAAARNNGISAARGRYVAFQDHDDLSLPDRLERQVAIAEEQPGIGMVFGDMEDLCDGVRTGVRRLRHHDPSRLSGSIFEYLLLWWVVGPIPLIPRRVFDEVGGFDETFRHCCADWDMWLRITRRYKAVYVDRVLALYRQHEANRTRVVGRELILREHRRTLDKVYSEPTIPRAAWKVRRRAYAHIYYKAARDLAFDGHRREALGIYLQALAWDPSFWRPVAGVVRLTGAGCVFAGARAAARALTPTRGGSPE